MKKPIDNNVNRMVFTRSQKRNIVAQFEDLRVNQQEHNMENPMNYLLIPFEGNINNGYPQGINIYLQETSDINTRDIIEQFLSLEKMLGTPCIHDNDHRRQKEHLLESRTDTPTNIQKHKYGDTL